MARHPDAETAIACLDTARTVFGLDLALLRDWVAGDVVAGLRVASSTVGSESGPESLVRQRLFRAGIALRQQVDVPGVGRIDGVIGDRVVVEIDGFRFHRDAEAFENDRRRDAELAARGYAVIRLSYRRITESWEWCESVIRRVLARPVPA
jgi:very-short-patch-repair endonuclease